MVNNSRFIKWVQRGVALIFCLFSIVTSAQKISKFYTSSLQANGMLYFFKPQKGFAGSGSHGKLINDVTLFAKSDSLTFNFSYFDKTALQLEQISFVSATHTITVPLQKLYVETKKNNWHYRYSARLLQKSLQLFYASDKIPGIILQTNQGEILLSVSKRQWQKIAGRNRRLFTLVALN